MASKSKVKKERRATPAKKIDFYLIAIPVTAFLIKLIIMANIKGTNGVIAGGWLGADGENYLSGVGGLLKDGYFSDKSILSYWPAGYPILIWALAKISLTHLIYLISFTQSIFYAYASYYFVKQLRATRLQPFISLIGLILAFNPTLSLTSLAIGYESPIAASMLMVLGLIMKSLQSGHDRAFILRVISVGFFFALAAFMQPRWVLTSIVIALSWALMTQGRKAQALILIGVIGIMAIAPAILVQRNQRSINKSVISTNLGATMRLGAGDKTSGGYAHTGPDIPCDPQPPATTISDNDLVKCVITWYVSHPGRALHLFINKGWYYWSPWSGPLANGTMARNPWLKIDPIVNIANGSQSGHDIIYKSLGRAISFFWVIGSISLFFIGFFWLRSMKGIYANLAYLASLPVLVSWVVAMGTVGDHRFRLPTAPLSLFLQLMGYFALRHRVRRGSFALALESSPKAR